MRALWADEPTGYESAFGAVQASEAHPKPFQRPRGPVNGPRTLIGGGAGPKLFAHIAEYADGWLPIGGGGLTESLPKLRAAWEEAGRDPKGLQVVPYAVQPSPGKLGHYAELGIEEVVLRCPRRTKRRCCGPWTRTPRTCEKGPSGAAGATAPAYRASLFTGDRYTRATGPPGWGVE